MKRIEITVRQAQQFNMMRDTLIKIKKGYMTPDQIRKDADKKPGLDFEEYIEMAYENIQIDAGKATFNVRPINIE